MAQLLVPGSAGVSPTEVRRETFWQAEWRGMLRRKNVFPACAHAFRKMQKAARWKRASTDTLGDEGARGSATERVDTRTTLLPSPTRLCW